jgi:hypothetical protein
VTGAARLVDPGVRVLELLSFKTGIRPDESVGAHLESAERGVGVLQPESIASWK